MPDTGLFHLFEVSRIPGAATQTTINVILCVRAECLSCHQTLRATAPPALLNISGGGAVLECPVCFSRQPISGARFVDFLDRYPHGCPPR